MVGAILQQVDALAQQELLALTAAVNVGKDDRQKVMSNLPHVKLADTWDPPKDEDTY